MALSLGSQKLRVSVQGLKYPFKAVPILEDGTLVAVVPASTAAAVLSRLERPAPQPAPAKRFRRRKAR